MKKGFTLIEMMVVLGLFVILFAATLTVLTTQDRAWQTGQNKLTEQQEARKAIDSLALLLRQSNPDWVINGTHYNVSITDSNRRIDFYQPVFTAIGEISSLQKVTFKLKPVVNSTLFQLTRQIGTGNETGVANSVELITFGGGCAGCAAYNCSSVDVNCPVVVVEVKTQKEVNFTLDSQITLRNTNVILSDGVVIEEPEEGEF